MCQMRAPSLSDEVEVSSGGLPAVRLALCHISQSRRPLPELISMYTFADRSKPTFGPLRHREDGLDDSACGKLLIEGRREVVKVVLANCHLARLGIC